MARRAGRHRAQLLLLAPSRSRLRAALEGWVPMLEGLESGRRLRWSLDVDPVELT
jgi:primosomal protein N' (replication factor Y)